MLSAQQVHQRKDRILNQTSLSHQARLLAYHWLEIAGFSLVPSRDAIDPNEIKNTLSNIIIHQFLPDGRIWIRLAGTAFFDVFGFEIAGSNYLDLVAPARQKQARDRLSNIITQPCGLHTQLSAPTKSGTFRCFESFGLPLVGSDGIIDSAIYTNIEVKHEYFNADLNNQVRNITAKNPSYIDLGNGTPPGPIPC